MIKIRLTELLEGRSYYWLAQETGAKWDTIKSLATGKSQRLDFELLERICLALKCQPGDLIHLDKKQKGKRR